MGIDAKSVSKLGIHYVKEGPPELVRALNEIIDGMDRLYPHPTPDIISLVTANGTTHKLRGIPARPPPAGAAAAALPFQIYDASVLTGTPTANISVTYGIVNAQGVVLGAGVIGDVPAPTLNLNTTGTWRIYIRSTGSSHTIFAVVGAQPADTSSFTYNTIGEVVVISSGGGLIVSVINNAKTSSLTNQNCSGSNWNWGQQ